MTVSTTTNKSAQTGNGVTTLFGFPIPFIAASDLQVYVGGVLKALTTDYSISGSAPYPAGANITFVTAPINLAAVLIVRTRPYTQTLDLVPNDPLPADTVEQLLGDHMVMLIQQLKEITDRSFTLAITDVSGASLAIPTPVASQLLGWNSTATGLTNYAGTSSVLISGAMTPVVQAATLVLGRAALGAAGLADNNAFTGTNSFSNTNSFTGANSFSLSPTVPAPAQGDYSLKAVNSQYVTQNQAGGFINLFRNASGTAIQRGATYSITAATPTYSNDGWIVTSTGATVSGGQAGQITGALAPWGLYTNTLVGLTGLTYKQRIESNRCAGVNGKQVTVQFKLLQTTGSPLTPKLTVKHANAVDNWGATTTDVNAVSLQAVPSGVTTTVAYTFAASASSSNGLEITLDWGSLSLASQTVQMFDPDIRPTSGVTTGLNSSPPVAEIRPAAIELVECQRFYEQSVGLWTNNGGFFNTPFKVIKRATPSVTAAGVTVSNITTESFRTNVGSITDYGWIASAEL